MRVLGLESSCDETACAIVDDGTTVISDVVASQNDVHAKYGGVVPELASRAHILNVVPVVQAALERAGCTLAEIDGIAVTNAPGLVGALLVGLQTAKALAWVTGKPLVGVHHLEGHLSAVYLEPDPPPMPHLALIVSGGHTSLVRVNDHADVVELGATRDDAAGEAFDKVGRLLGLPFPGGPHVARMALEGEATSLKLPRAWMQGTFDFSFSGLKTAALHAVREEKHSTENLAWEFQEAVVDVLAGKTSRLARELGAKNVLVAGGVAANQRLREELQRRCPVPVRIPPPKYCTDNAAMIGAVAGYRLDLGERSPLDEDIFTTNNWARV